MTDRDFEAEYNAAAKKRAQAEKDDAELRQRLGLAPKPEWLRNAEQRADEQIAEAKNNQRGNASQSNPYMASLDEALNIKGRASWQRLYYGSFDTGIRDRAIGGNYPDPYAPMRHTVRPVTEGKRYGFLDESERPLNPLRDDLEAKMVGELRVGNISLPVKNISVTYTNSLHAGKLAQIEVELSKKLNEEMQRRAYQMFGLDPAKKEDQIMTPEIVILSATGERAFVIQPKETYDDASKKIVNGGLSIKIHNCTTRTTVIEGKSSKEVILGNTENNFSVRTSDLASLIEALTRGAAEFLDVEFAAAPSPTPTE